MTEKIPLLATRAIHKRYNGVPVLNAIDFTLLPGQVQALMGGNGAGKSTLMKIIAGIQAPDSGEILINHQVFHRLKPDQAHELGIYMVAQEPMLFADLTVQENILFRLPGKADRHTGLQEKLKQLECHLNLQAAAGTLNVAGQQMVEILRGLMCNAKVLILDEPTSSLTPGETLHLFRQIRALQASGVGIIFISHKLPEIRALASHVSVLRDGVIVLRARMPDISDADLIHAMTPHRRDHSLSDTQKLWLELPGQAKSSVSEQPVLRAENLSGEGFSHVHLSIHAGEIVGLAGLVGAGRTELAETLYGLRPLFSGAIWFKQQEISHDSIKQRLQKGLVYLPEDRQAAGLFADASICWNTTLLQDPTFWIRPKREAAVVERYRRALGIKFQQWQQLVRTLSGGNQQKILLARCLEARPVLFIVDEPTRGVDVATRADIYQLLKSIAAQQVAVLMISSDVDEFPGLADRVLVMHQGQLIGALSKQEISVDRMMNLAFGGHRHENPVT